MRLILFFPPGWSMNVGNPHIALPLLNAVLKKEIEDVRIRDLNWEIAEYYAVRIGSRDAREAVKLGSLEAMNMLYFNVEDRLNEIAKAYNGEWNLELGFSFNNISLYSSKGARDALIIDSPFTKYYRENILPWVEREKPEIIGFSIASIYQIVPTLHLSWMLRKAGFGGVIIFGGNTISRLKEDIIKTCWLFDYIDGFIVFQGELSLLNLCKTIRARGDFSNIPNLIWRDKGTIKENSILKHQDENLILTPNFGDLPIGKYWGVNYLPLLGSRGCYYGKCSFCAIPYGYGTGGFTEIREAELILGDVINLANKHNIKMFKFMDEAIPPKTLIRLSDLIIREGIQIQWEGYLRLEGNWLNKLFVNKVARSGFKKGYFGLEIYSADRRKTLNKNDNAKGLLDILMLCSDVGIKVHLFCMFGFPGTGLREAEETVDFILNHSDLIDSVDLNAYTYARHTNVPGIKKIVDTKKDWALEYDYVNLSEGTLSSKDVEALVAKMEEMVWKECPRLLHPIYRLVSPWDNIQHIQDTKSSKEYASIIL